MRLVAMQIQLRSCCLRLCMHACIAAGWLHVFFSFCFCASKHQLFFFFVFFFYKQKPFFQLLLPVFCIIGHPSPKRATLSLFFFDRTPPYTPNHRPSQDRQEGKSHLKQAQSLLCPPCCRRYCCYCCNSTLTCDRPHLAAQPEIQSDHPTSHDSLVSERDLLLASLVLFFYCGY